MRKIGIFSLVLLLLVFGLTSFASAALKTKATQMTQLGVGVGGGLYAGGFTVGGDVLYRMPLLGFQKTYIRVGVNYVDTKNLTPAQAWRKFAPVFIDGVYYFDDIFYIGGGLNYPLKVSDGKTGNVGGQVYVGANHRTGDGRLYLDMGYSALRMQNEASFKGMHVVAGYRYDYATFTYRKKIKEPKRRIIVIEEEQEILDMAFNNMRGPKAVMPPRKARKPVQPVAEKPGSKRVWHYVSVGETLDEISIKYYGTIDMVSKISEMNNIEDPNFIVAGRYLLIDPAWAK